jgi:hypothetical protein
MEFLRHLFSFVCSQVNCWSAAGVSTIACQRCTGLYIGSCIAAVLFALFRPRPTPLSLWLHGLMMLVLVPFGYHLVPHGSLVRAATGQLFGYGMAYYLLLVPADHHDLWRSPVHALPAMWYPIGLVTAVPIVVLTGLSGSYLSIVVLNCLVSLGATVISLLIAWNASLLVAIAWRNLHPRASAL